MWAPWRATPAPAPRRLLASIGADASLVTDRGAAAILSPDGTTLVFSAQQKQPDASVHPQTRSAAGDAARRHRGSGLPVLLAGRPVDCVLRRGQAEEGLGGWRRGGHSVRCRARVAAGPGSPTTRSSSVPRVARTARSFAWRRAGGKPTAFGTLSQGATTQRWPQVLPGGKTVLYTEHSTVPALTRPTSSSRPSLLTRRRRPGPAKVVVPNAYYGRYVASGLTSPRRGDRERGHLLYIQQGTLFAVPFDLGPPRDGRARRVPAIRRAHRRLRRLVARRWTCPRDGTLAYVPGGVTSNLANAIDWITRDGKTTGLRAAKNSSGRIHGSRRTDRRWPWTSPTASSETSGCTTGPGTR